MKEILLTKGKVTIVDDLDFDRFGHLRCFASEAKSRPTYATVSTGTGRKDKKTEYLHRLIMDAPRGIEVGHINGDSLDNRRCNLRLATRAQNACNTRMRSHSTIGLKGVERDGKRYRARITVGGKRLPLGSFDSKEEAYSAYCKAAKELHGEFARLK